MKFTRDELVERLELHGWNHAALARELGISRQAVHHHCARHGVVGPDCRKRASRPLASFDVEEWEILSSRDIAALTGLHPATASRFRRRHELPHQSRPISCRWRKHCVRALWIYGLSVKDIAHEVGTTVSGVIMSVVRMRRAGFDLPYRRQTALPGSGN